MSSILIACGYTLAKRKTTATLENESLALCRLAMDNFIAAVFAWLMSFIPAALLLYSIGNLCQR